MQEQKQRTLEDITDAQFLAKALSLAQKADRADRVLKIADGQQVKNPQQDRKPPPEYVRAVRFHAINAVFEEWNRGVEEEGEGRELYVGDITPLVQAKVKVLMSIREWKWGLPSDLTVRRRVEEAARPEFYPETRQPAITSVNPTFYRPSPFYLDPSTKKAMREQVKAREILA